MIFSQKWFPLLRIMLSLSNRVFENHYEIIEATCDACQRLIAKPETITSIGMWQWTHDGQTQ